MSAPTVSKAGADRLARLARDVGAAELVATLARRRTTTPGRPTSPRPPDRAGLSARQIADQLGNAKVSKTQDRHLGRRAVTSDAANALDASYAMTLDEGPDTSSGG